jgi:hypothetical protein
VKAYLEQRRGTLPADVDLLLVNDDSVPTSSMLDVLISNAAAGIVLVIMVWLVSWLSYLTKAEPTIPMWPATKIFLVMAQVSLRSA